MKISAAEYQKLISKQPKKSREGNKPKEYNGVMYQSTKEAHRAQQLDWMVAAEHIKTWERQVPIKIEIGGYHITTYLCDFVVDHGDKLVYEDCKGRKSGGPYQMFQIKKRLVKALLGIDIIEI